MKRYNGKPVQRMLYSVIQIGRFFHSPKNSTLGPFHRCTYICVVLVRKPLRCYILCTSVASVEIFPCKIRGDSTIFPSNYLRESFSQSVAVISCVMRGMHCLVSVRNQLAELQSNLTQKCKQCNERDPGDRVD